MAAHSALLLLRPVTHLTPVKFVRSSSSGRTSSSMSNIGGCPRPACLRPPLFHGFARTRRPEAASTGSAASAAAATSAVQLLLTKSNGASRGGSSWRAAEGEAGAVACTAAAAAAGGAAFIGEDFGSSAADDASFDTATGHDTYSISTPATWVDRVRAVAFYVVTLLIAVPLFCVMLLIFPFVMLFDRVRRRAQHAVNDVWANTTTSLFYRTEVEGAENLPRADEGAVYVANHQSYLDIYTLFQLRRPFKFISKTSNFLIPIVGWSMFLTGHVPLKRTDKRSQMDCLKQCLQLLQKGVPVLFFPEGTRTTDGYMSGFKKGAFTIAAKAGVPVIPIALVGTGTLMPNGEEGSLRAAPGTLEQRLGVGAVKVVVHPPLTGGSADELCETARAVIADTLKAYNLGVHEGEKGR